jgi:hypothetical protein
MPRSKTTHRTVPPLLVGDPTVPLAISSTMWFSTPGAKPAYAEALRFAFPSCISLQSIARVNLAHAPQRVGSSPGLSYPSALSNTASPLVWQASIPTFVPPSGFGYPLGGFLLAASGEPSFMLTALLGFSPSKPCVPRRYRARYHDDWPTCRLSHTLLGSSRKPNGGVGRDS